MKGFRLKTVRLQERCVVSAMQACQGIEARVLDYCGSLPLRIPCAIQVPALLLLFTESSLLISGYFTASLCSRDEQIYTTLHFDADRAFIR